MEMERAMEKELEKELEKDGSMEMYSARSTHSRSI